MAGDRGSNSRTERGKVLILFGFVRIGSGVLNDLGQHPLQSRSFQPNGCRFDCKCLWAKGFHLKTVAFQLLGYSREDHHLPCLQFHQKGHE